MLIDAMAVQGALSKGRSSALSLRREVRRIAALTLAGGLVVSYLYVPSEFNPADDPSRGWVSSRRARASAIRSWARPSLDPASQVIRRPAARHEELWLHLAESHPEAVAWLDLVGDHGAACDDLECD